VIGDNEASFGVARRGDLWYAVHASRIRQGRLGTDVRYDLGIVGLKRRVNGTWRDLMVHRPNTMGQDNRDSIGPVRVSGERLYPAAPATVEPTSTGGFMLRGGFWLNNRNKGIQRKAVFRYEPTACGVKQTFPGKRGEVYEMSYFFRDRPAKKGRSLVGQRERVKASVPFSVQIQANNHRSRPYASAMHGPLFRARMRVRVPKSGRVSFESC
jgi:hypothetical protein